MRCGVSEISHWVRKLGYSYKSKFYEALHGQLGEEGHSTNEWNMNCEARYNRKYLGFSATLSIVLSSSDHFSMFSWLNCFILTRKHR